MVTMQPQAITKVSISALVISLPIIYVSLLRVPPSTLARDSTFWFLMSNSIIAIIAADFGMLFLGSSHHDDDDHSEVVPSEQPVPAVAHEEYYRDPLPLSLPLMASSPEPTAPVDISCVLVGGGELLPSGSVSFNLTATDGTDEDQAMALMDGEGAASKPGTDMVVNHASDLQSCEAEEAPELEPIANKNDAMIVEGDQCIVSPAPQIEPGDGVPQDEVKEEAKLRCSVAEESKPARPGEEREYWQLSDEELNRKVEEFITRFNRDMIQQEAAAV